MIAYEENGIILGWQLWYIVKISDIGELWSQMKLRTDRKSLEFPSATSTLTHSDLLRCADLTSMLYICCLRFWKETQQIVPYNTPSWDK